MRTVKITLNIGGLLLFMIGTMLLGSFSMDHLMICLCFVGCGALWVLAEL